MEAKKTYLSEYKPVYIPDIAKKLNTGAAQSFINEVKEKIDQVLGQQNQ
jgi:hypothetical protein